MFMLQSAIFSVFMLNKGLHFSVFMFHSVTLYCLHHFCCLSQYVTYDCSLSEDSMTTQRPVADMPKVDLL